MTTVKNVSNFQISIILNNVRFRRDLKPGQTMTFPSEEILEEFNFDPGCRNYVRNGFLKVHSTEAAQEEVVAAAEDAELDIRKLLSEGTIQDLSKALREGSPALKERIVDEAMKLSIADAPRVSLIKAHCGVDIVSALALQRSIN